MIWIDLENSPHVLFFQPIIERLWQRGEDVFLTARDFAQTIPLLEETGYPFHTVGTRAQGGKVKKALALLERGRQLRKLLRAQGVQPTVSMGHGSRGHLIGAAMARIPALTTYDYEYVDSFLHNYLAKAVFVPAVLSDDDLRSAGIRRANLHRYPGLKEEVYLRNFTPDPNFPKATGLDPSKIKIVVRPPSAGSHYHRSEAEQLLLQLLRRIAERNDIQCILLPRYPEQRAEMVAHFQNAHCDVLMPEHTLDGKNLIFYADAVVSGGGTMIREAAVLGVPAYTIFQGRKGGVDRHLAETGRLRFLDSAADVERVPLSHRPPVSPSYEQNDDLVEFFVEAILRYRKN